MKPRKPGWDKLNAYVDGELRPAEAEEISRAANLDPDIAGQIALLYHMKGSVQAALPSAPPDLDLPEAPKQGRIGVRFFAACISGLALLAMIAFSLIRTTAPTVVDQHAFMDTARYLHEQWLAKEKSQTTDTPPVILAALTRFGSLPVVPDLESTGLSIGLVSVSERREARILQIGYRGHHGCHLSLFVLRDGHPFDVALDDRKALERVRIWQVANLDYLLFSRGMDVRRFSLIAETVERATRAGAPLSDRDRQLLAENKRNSASCQA